MICETCGVMGGSHAVKAPTNKEVMDNMWKHMQEAHPEEAKKMMSMPKEQQDKMMMETEKSIHDAE